MHISIHKSHIETFHKPHISPCTTTIAGLQWTSDDMYGPECSKASPCGWSSGGGGFAWTVRSCRAGGIQRARWIDRYIVKDDNLGKIFHISFSHLNPPPPPRHARTHTHTHTHTHARPHAHVQVRTQTQHHNTLSHSLVHSLTHSPTHSFTHSPRRPLTRSLTHSLTHSHPPQILQPILSQSRTGATPTH